METYPGIVRGCVTVCTRARRVVKSTRDDSRSTLSPSLPVSRYCYVRAVHANVSPAKSNVLQAHACSYAPGEQRPPLVTFIYSEAAEIFGTAPHPHFPLSIIHRRGSIISANNDLSPLFERTARLELYGGGSKGVGYHHWTNPLITGIK